MPAFDHSSSRLDRNEAKLLRDVLGPARPIPTSLRAASRGYRRQRRRAQLKRALIVATLAVAFCGSAFLVSDNHSARSTVATRVAPDNLDPEVTGSIGGVAPAPSPGRTVVDAGR